jgi:hypothetical protein
VPASTSKKLGITNNMESISDYQKEVFTLLGRHLVQFQAVEIWLKELLRLSNISITKSSLSKNISTNQKLPEKNIQTLGVLTNQVLQDFFVRNNQNKKVSGTNENNNNDGFKINFSAKIGLCNCHWEKLNIEFQNFITDRNFIVHHFLSKFNIMELDNCLNAIKYLKETQLKHQPFIKKIEDYHNQTKKNFEHSFDEFIQFLQSTLGRTLFLFPSDEIYQEILLLLEDNKKKEGWLSITTTTQHISKKFPEYNKRIKESYGFKHLQDLILNSGLYKIQI